MERQSTSVTKISECMYIERLKDGRLLLQLCTTGVLPCV